MPQLPIIHGTFGNSTIVSKYKLGNVNIWYLYLNYPNMFGSILPNCNYLHSHFKCNPPYIQQLPDITRFFIPFNEPQPELKIRCYRNYYYIRRTSKCYIKRCFRIITELTHCGVSVTSGGYLSIDLTDLSNWPAEQLTCNISRNIQPRELWNNF